MGSEEQSVGAQPTPVTYDTVEPVKRDVIPRDTIMSPRNFALFTFVLLSYLLSWSFWFWPIWANTTIVLGERGSSFEIPLKAVMRLLGDLGPGIAAVIVVRKYYGSESLRELLARLIPRSLRWTVVALVAPAAILILAFVCAGHPFSEFLNLASIRHWFRVFAVNVLFAPLWEELGWRGYLFPQIQALRNPLVASLTVGTVWGLWHTPLYLRVSVPGSSALVFMLCFVVLTLGLSILFSWIYNATDGSLFPVVMLHASFNSSIITFLGPAMATSGIGPFLEVIIGIWIVALALLVFVGRDLSCESLRNQHYLTP